MPPFLHINHNCQYMNVWIVHSICAYQHKNKGTNTEPNNVKFEEIKNWMLCVTHYYICFNIQRYRRCLMFGYSLIMEKWFFEICKRKSQDMN